MYTYTIDPVLGNDRNDGSPASPLKTHREVVQRGFDSPPSGWGKGRLLEGFSSPVFGPGVRIIGVNIIGDLPASDPIDVDITLDWDTLLGYVGTPRTLRTGTLTTVVTKNRSAVTVPAGGQPWEIQDAGTPFTAADVGRRIRITSGPNAGQIAWGARLLPNGNLRTSSFSDPDIDAVDLPDVLLLTGITTGVVAPGDPYVVEELSKATIRQVDGRIPNAFSPNIGFANLDFQGVFTPNGEIPITPESAQLNFKACKFSGRHQPTLAFPRITYINCCAQLGIALPSTQGAWILNTPNYFRGGLALGSVSVRLDLSQFDDDFMIQSGCLIVTRTSSAGIAAMCVFDSPIEGVGLGALQGSVGYSGAQCSSIILAITGGSGSSLLWGSGNAGPGVKVYGGNQLVIADASPTPSITGSAPGANDFDLSGALFSRAWNEALGTYTEAGGPPTRANSWANLAGAIGAGGFGRNAHNVERNVHIVMRG